MSLIWGKKQGNWLKVHKNWEKRYIKLGYQSCVLLDLKFYTTMSSKVVYISIYVFNFN